MRWMWIDRIVDFEAESRLTAVKNVSLAEEHLHDHFPGDDAGEARAIMPASLIIEGMAQTAGVLVGTMSRFQEKVILAKITRATVHAEVLPGQTLRYEAMLDSYDHAGAATSGIVRRMDHSTSASPDWEEIGRIDLMFSHVDRNLRGVEFPEENFVFSDNFRILLRDAGLSDLADP